ncbi:MAG: efflux RND transporter periplasmic adaptor subunit [Tahibacter sp.]
MSRTMYRYGIIIIASAFALGACGKSDPKPAAAPAVPVTTTIVAAQSWSDVIEALGTAQANESITLTAKITETVRRVNFTDGQKVAAGDVLIELSSNQQVAQLRDAQATANDANRQFSRQQDLVKQGTVSKSMFDTAQATRDSNSARVEAIRATLSDRVITAPFAGVLGLRRVSLGTLVTPGTAITTLDDIHQIKLDFAVPETELAAIRAGLTIRARTPAYPERAFEGRIESLDSRVDPVTRAITVRAIIANPDALLLPGMLLNVDVLSRERETLVVPELALVPVGTRQSVYTVGADNIAHLVAVKTGARRAGEAEVLEGLAAGDRIVVEGTVSLRDGATVAIKQGLPGAAQTASK